MNGSPAALLWSCEQDSASGHYRYNRWRVLFGALNSARYGLLAAEWRQQVVPSESNYGLHIVNDALIEHEVATMPPQKWEPFVADGDSRAALDAWYNATLLLDEYRQTTHAAASSSRLSILDQYVWQNMHDLWGASYRAGLKSMGYDIDWANWYHTRIESRVPPTAASRAQHKLDWPALRRYLERLPRYWI